MLFAEAGLQLPAGSARQERDMPGLVVRPGEGQQRGGASPAAWGGCPGPRQVRSLMSGPGCGRAGAPALATGSLDGRPEPKPAGPDFSRWPFGGSFDDLDVGARNLCRPLARASESPAGCRGAPGPHSPPPLLGPAPLPAPGPVLPPGNPLSLDTKRGGHLAGRQPALGLPGCCSAHVSGQRASWGQLPRVRPGVEGTAAPHLPLGEIWAAA